MESYTFLASCIRPLLLSIMYWRSMHVGVCLSMSLIPNRHMERCATSPTFKKMQIKITIRCHLRPVTMAVIKNTAQSKCWRSCGGKESSCTVGSSKMKSRPGQSGSVGPVYQEVAGSIPDQGRCPGLGLNPQQGCV